MSTVNDHITEYLDYYLALPNAPEYAVLLRGDWGSGKSFFAKNYRENHPDQKYLTVSLYGTTSFKEIEDSFFQQIHPILGSKAMKITSKLLTGVVKGALKIDLNGDAKGGDDMTATFSVPEFVTKFNKEAENRVLVFDDLERCNIRLTDLLGYINQYVENYGLKVILIANEQEIINKTKEAGDKEVSEYARVKEKLIGKSFDVTSDVDTALGVFIGEVGGNPGGAAMLKYKAQIKLIYETAGYQNLRHLKQSVLDFDRFFHFLPDKLDAKPLLLPHIISLFFAVSIEIKKGDIQPEEIARLFLIDSLAKMAGAEPNAVQKIIAKYPVLGMYHQPFAGTFLVQFFKNGTVDKASLANSINNSVFYAEENKATWVRLWYFSYLEDSDLAKYTDEIWDKLTKKEIEDKYVLLHVVGILLHLHKLGLFDQEPGAITAASFANLDDLAAKGKLLMAKYDKINTSNAYGFEYLGKAEPAFKDFVAKFTKDVADAQTADLPAKAKKLLEDFKKSDSVFIVNTTFSNARENLYYDVPVLTYIPVCDFVDTFMQLKNNRKAQFFSSLKLRYENVTFRTELVPEADWWKKVMEEFQKRATAKKGTITGFLLESALIDIAGYINLLRPVPSA